MVTSAASRSTPIPSGGAKELRATWHSRASWPLAALLLGALVLRLVLWDRAYGFEQGDPVEYVNIAYRIAFGIGIPWWDLRPLALSLLYVPVMLVMQWWPDPTGEAMVRALRLVGVAFSLGSVALTYGIGRRLGGEVVGLTAGLLVAVNPVVNRLSASTFAEIPSTFFVLLAVWHLVGASANPHPAPSQGERVPEPSPPGRGQGEGFVRSAPRKGWRSYLDAVLLAGVALGAACMIRYQAIAYLPAFGLWVLARDLASAAPWQWPARLFDRRSRTLRFGLGLALAAVAQAFVETAAYGRPFHSLLVSFEYNVTSGLAPVEFGAEPFEWFAFRTPSWFGVLPALLALLELAAVVRGPRAAEWRLVGLAAAIMFGLLSALPHKEERFMIQVVPLLALFAGAGVSIVASVVGSWIAPRARVPVAALLAIVAAGPLLAVSWSLDVRANVAYVDGPKRAAELKPGGTLGTIPWFVPRPYTGTRLALERMDRRIWENRELVTQTIERSDFLLFPEYWLLEDPAVDRLVTAGFRNIESYENGVALYQSRRLDEPARRRPRS